MTPATDEANALAELDSRLKTVLPQEYQDSYEDVQPVPMGSAGLKYAADGSVAWDEIWGSFCDLAMAGGPPHKGTLLEPGLPEDIDAQPDRYQAVVDEICRGVTLATALPADDSPVPGWVRVDCYGETMAAWLLRAITMENVAVQPHGRALDLPAAPGFRLEKEIKNVITVVAKTSHYWVGHMPRTQREAIAGLFAALATDMPLVATDGVSGGAGADASVVDAMADRIRHDTGLRASATRYAGWLGVECPNVRAAVWMMRAMVVSNVLSRREGVVLFLPVNPASDPGGERVCRVVAHTYGLAAASGVL